MSGNAFQIIRYGINGVIATLVHYGVLVLLLEQVAIPSAGISNLIAAVFGISASFIGNRYFVFRQTQSAIWRQLWRFSALYGAIAVVHGATLWLWSDVGQFDYRLGFIVATIIQFVLSYTGNRFLVFK